MTQESFMAPTSIQIGLIKSRNLVSIRLVVAENWDSLRDSLSGTLCFRILNILPHITTLFHWILGGKPLTSADRTGLCAFC